MYKGASSKIYEELSKGLKLDKEGLPPGYREGQERVIYNFLKRIEKITKLEIKNVHESQILELSKAYFLDKYSKDKITFKEILDEMTKKAFKNKLPPKGYVSILDKIQSETLKKRQVDIIEIKSLKKMMSMVYQYSLFDVSNAMNLITETVWKTCDDEKLELSIETIKSQMDSHFKIIEDLIGALKKRLNGEMLIERVLLYFMFEDLKRKIVKLKEAEEKDLEFFLGIEKRYEIPIQDCFTLKEIALIMCQNDKSEFDKEYNNLRKLYSKMPLSLRYSTKSKKKKSYEGDKIPRRYVMNLLAEREIIKLKRRVKSYRNDEMLEHKIKKSKKEKQPLRLSSDFISLATLINARETKRAGLNWILKNIRAKVYVELIKILELN